VAAGRYPRSIDCPAAGVILRWLAGENFNNDILRALFRRKPGKPGKPGDGRNVFPPRAFAAVNWLYAEHPQRPLGASRSPPAARVWARPDGTGLAPSSSGWQAEAELGRELCLAQSHLPPTQRTSTSGTFTRVTRTESLLPWVHAIACSSPSIIRAPTVGRFATCGASSPSSRSSQPSQSP